MVLTPQEYVDQAGVRCPYCDSEDIRTVGTLTACGTVGMQGVQCNDCGREWDDVYSLTGWSPV